MGILKKYLFVYKKPVILGPLFKLFEAALELCVPLIITKIIDEGIKNSDKKYIFSMGAIMLVFAIMGYFSALIAQYYCAKAGVSIVCDVRRDLFNHVLHLSLSERDVVGKKTLITRLINDTNRVQTGINMFLRLVFRSPFILIGALVLSFSINKKLSLIFIVVVLLLFIIVFIIMKQSVFLYGKVQSDLDKVLGKTLENLSGIRVIRAFNTQEDEISSFEKRTHKLYKRQIKVSYIAGAMMPLTNFVVNIAIILILYIGGIEIHLGNLSQGQIVALVNYLNSMLIELLKTANLVIILARAYASACRINAMFKIENSLYLNSGDDTKKEYNNIVSFKDVYFRYSESRKCTLNDINFELKEGETLGIIGGTGSGKSSLVRLILRLYDVERGVVLFNGKNVKEYNINELRSNIGIVEQEAFFFRGSIRDNLKWGNEHASDEDILKAIKISQAIDIITKKDEGLDFLIQSMGKNLSGGQKQRLSIARAILKKPKLLILDDATSALDYLTDSKLREELSKIKMSMIIISGRVASLKKLDKILVLDNGKIVDIGSHNELYKKCDIYKEICLSQLLPEEV